MNPGQLEMDDSEEQYLFVTPKKNRLHKQSFLSSLVSSRFSTKSYFNHSSKVKQLNLIRQEKEKQIQLQKQQQAKMSTVDNQWATPQKGQTKQAPTQQTAATISLKKKITKPAAKPQLKTTRFGNSIYMCRIQRKTLQ